FSPDGKTIATASSDNTARLWDTENGNVLATLNHQFWVNAVAFSPDGKTIATASYDYTARLWDTENGNELATLKHQDSVYAVAFSPDGKTIATASSDNTVRLHWATPEGLIQEACYRLGWNLTAEEWQQYNTDNDLKTYQKTCDELPVHPSLIAEAKNLAKTGEKPKIKQAISIFKKALELEGEIDLDPNTKTRETNPQLVANKLAASGKLIEGQKLAKDGNTEEAISLFKEAQKLSPEIDLDPDTETRETDPQLVANKLAAPAKLIEGKKLAKEGKIKEAINLYKEAQKSDSDVEIDVENWLELCFLGSLNNQAQDVMFACEKAVKLDPNDINTHFARGFARALTGDYQGAIDDFQVLVDTTKDEETKDTWEGVIEILKKGVNPWTSESLEDLKKDLTD
ncbi:MAG: hypothetical protein O4965_04225, partial [Trichodesmium sp. St19_bin1]|nr:hypothetical protein [Trichodesmium sp. St19_bin1]